MANILTSLTKTVWAGVALTVLFIIYFISTGGALDAAFWALILRYAHVLSGIMWIGLLWYFNFVQIPNMPKIPDEQKPAIGKVIAPAALFWFRWGAMAIGIGMWLGTIRFINVWFVIWPNQKRALGIVEADADTKAASARTAMLFSRTNTLLSIPMLFAMASAQNIW